MKKVFTEANGYDADFFYSLKNEEQIAAAQKYSRMEVGVQRVLASVHRGGDGSQCPAFSTYSVLVLHDSGRAQFARVCAGSSSQTRD